MGESSGISVNSGELLVHVEGFGQVWATAEDFEVIEDDYNASGFTTKSQLRTAVTRECKAAGLHHGTLDYMGNWSRIELIAVLVELNGRSL